MDTFVLIIDPIIFLVIFNEKWVLNKHFKNKKLPNFIRFFLFSQKLDGHKPNVCTAAWYLSESFIVEMYTHLLCTLTRRGCKECTLCLALSLMGTRMRLSFLAGADRPSLWPQLPLHSERVSLLTWLTAGINCHRALCDPGMQLPTDPNHLLGRKSLSLTPCCQHLPVDASLSPLSFYFFSLPLPASHSWCLARDTLIKSSCYFQSNRSVFGICECYRVVLKQ